MANRNGLVLVGAYTILGFAWQLTFNSLFVDWLRGRGFPVSRVNLPTIDASFGVLAVAAVASLLALVYLNVVAIRTFVGGHTRSIPPEYYTRNVGRAIVNTVVGGVAFGVIVLVGSLLLVVPGVVAYVAFIFMAVYVAVEDENFVAAFRDSWRLTRGHWLRLFLLLLVAVAGIGIVSAVLSVVVTLGAVAAGSRSLATVASTLVYLPLAMVMLGVVAAAFDQLRAESGVGRDAAAGR